MSSIMVQERILRLFTLFLTSIATPLLIASTILSVRINREQYWNYRSITAFCFGYIPLALTVAASIASLHHDRKHRIAGVTAPARPRMALLDLLAGVSYLSILLPIWTIEIGALREPGLGLLAGYTTAPMILNMLIHFGVFLCNFQELYASFTDDTCRQCPNCRNKFTVGVPAEVRTAAKKGEGYSLLRSGDYLDADDDAVIYIDAQASVDLRPEEEQAVKVKKVEV